MDKKWTPCAAQSAEYHAGYEQAMEDTASHDLYDALKYVRRLVKAEDVDTAFIDGALAKAEGRME